MAEDSAEGETRVQKRSLLSLVILHIANDSYFGFLPPILPLLVIEMDLPLSLAGLLSSMFAFTGAVGQPLFGYFSDRLRKGWLVALGPIAGAFMTLLIYMPNYASMLLLLLFAGAGSACFHPVASVIASEISGKRKGFGVSIYVAGGRLGVGLGAALSTFIVTTWGLQAIPLGGLLGLAIGFPFFFIAPKIKPATTASPESFRDTVSSLSKIMNPLFIMWLVNLCRTTVTIAISTYMPLYIVASGGSIGAGGRAITLFLFAAAMGGVSGGYLSDLFGRRLIMIESLLVGIPLLGVTFMMAEPLRTVFLMLSGAAIYSSMGVSVTYAQEVAPDHKALVSAFMLGVVWFVGSMITIAIGAVGDVYGILKVLPAASVAIGAIGAVLSFGLPRMAQDR